LQRWPAESALLTSGIPPAAHNFRKIKHNFKTSHKRPPGLTADNYLRQHSKLNQNTGLQQFCEPPKPASDHLLNIHTSAGFEAPISGWF
jgi:hypothetical protein